MEIVTAKVSTGSQYVARGASATENRRTNAPRTTTLTGSIKNAVTGDGLPS